MLGATVTHIVLLLSQDFAKPVQHAGEPYRVLYAFDPRRVALLLIGGKKTGDDRWYETYIPTADRLYDEHLETQKKEGLI